MKHVYLLLLLTGVSMAAFGAADEAPLPVLCEPLAQGEDAAMTALLLRHLAAEAEARPYRKVSGRESLDSEIIESRSRLLLMEPPTLTAVTVGDELCVAD